MFSNAIWFPTLFGRWQSYFVTRSMIGITDSYLHYWSEICWKSKLDVSGESSCDWCTMRITAGMDVWSNISRRWEARTILMILRWGTPLTDSYLGSTSIGEKNLNAFIVLDTNAKELTTDRVWFLKYLQETWWTKTNGCREQNFTWGSKRKDEDPIWPNASLTSCLSASIRFSVESCSNYISFQYFVFLTQSKYYQIQGHGASEPEIVQGWLPGV